MSKVAGLPQMKAGWIVGSGSGGSAAAGDGAAGGDRGYVSVDERSGAGERCRLG